jgi:hypothetical protein
MQPFVTLRKPNPKHRYLGDDAPVAQTRCQFVNFERNLLT